MMEKLIIVYHVKILLLYDEYPEYKETENYFLVNGNRVKRFKTIKENQIKNGKPIILIKEEEL